MFQSFCVHNIVQWLMSNFYLVFMVHSRKSLGKSFIKPATGLRRVLSSRTSSPCLWSQTLLVGAKGSIRELGAAWASISILGAAGKQNRFQCQGGEYPSSSGADCQPGHCPQFIHVKLQKKCRLYSSPQHQSSILPISLHLQKLKYLIPESRLQFHWTQHLHCGVNHKPFEVDESFVTGENKARYLTGLW